ncbi:TadE/TadG family type IV pilus assembly protein [Streptosporangium sp. NPDC051022]|uniref:TadE family protein n=1 Tax=Streptosporangium sp. NPDC051022 TaxID=3155752 RepID=UPI003439FDB0
MRGRAGRGVPRPADHGLPGDAPRSGHGAAERGAITVEVLVVLPVIMLVILACMQVCLLFFARSVALAAAQEGVRAARAEGGVRTAGADAARRYAERTAGGFLTSISASSGGDVATVRVTVRGQSLSLVPFLPSIRVTEEAAGAVERFTTPEGSGP